MGVSEAHGKIILRNYIKHDVLEFDYTCAFVRHSMRFTIHDGIKMFFVDYNIITRRQLKDINSQNVLNVFSFILVPIRNYSITCTIPTNEDNLSLAILEKIFLIFSTYYIKVI